MFEKKKHNGLFLKKKNIISYQLCSIYIWLYKDPMIDSQDVSSKWSVGTKQSGLLI